MELVQYELGGGHGGAERQELLLGDFLVEVVHLLLLRLLVIGQHLDGRERRVDGQELHAGGIFSKNSLVGRLAGHVEGRCLGIHGLLGCLLVRLRGFGFSLRDPYVSIFFQI